MRVHRTSAGRAGKTVTIITGLEGHEQELALLARKLKARCGAGGTLKGGAIEIQGDHVMTVLEALSEDGYRPRRSGG